MGLIRAIVGCSFSGRSRDDIHRIRFPDDVSEAVWIQQHRSQHAGRCPGATVGHVDGRLDTASRRTFHSRRNH